MDYAIISFIDDDAISEIPTNWLQKDENKLFCWWPLTNKNLTLLLAKRVEPDIKTWSLFPVKVKKYCSTLQEAREAVENEHFTSTEDNADNVNSRDKRNTPIKLKSQEMPHRPKSVNENENAHSFSTPPSSTNTHNKEKESSSQSIIETQEDIESARGYKDSIQEPNQEILIQNTEDITTLIRKVAEVQLDEMKNILVQHIDSIKPTIKIVSSIEWIKNYFPLKSIEEIQNIETLLQCEDFVNEYPPSHDSSKELQENKLSKSHDEIKELRNDLKVIDKTTHAILGRMLLAESQTDLKKKFKELQTIDKANKTPRDEVKEKRQRTEKRSYSPDERYQKKNKINYNNSKNKDKDTRGRVKVTESISVQIFLQIISKIIKKYDKLMAKMNDRHDSISDLTDEQSSSPSAAKKKKNVRHRRISRNLDKENYSRSANLHDEKVHLSQASSRTSKAGKQKKFFEENKSRNTDNSDDSLSSNDESDSPDDYDNNGKHKKKELKKSEREEEIDCLQTLTQKSEQLYGKYYSGDEMVLLKYNIYCRKIIFDSTLSVAKEVTHLLRRLIEGVFIVEKLLNCTMMGQFPRTQGTEKINKQYDSLDPTAIRAIQEFSLEYGKSKNWSIPSESKVKRTMTQKISELKNQFLKKQKRDTIRNNN